MSSGPCTTLQSGSLSWIALCYGAMLRLFGPMLQKFEMIQHAADSQTEGRANSRASCETEPCRQPEGVKFR